MKLPVLFIVLAGGAIIYIVLKKPSKRPVHQNSRPNSGDSKPTVIKQTKAHPDYFYLSVMQNFLERYQLDSRKDDSFYTLLSTIRKEGRRYFKAGLKALTGEAAAPAALMAYYKQWSVAPLNLPDTALAAENEDSPKIYRQAFEPKLTQFGLAETGETDLHKIVLQLLNKEYNEGKAQVAAELEANFTWLEKYLTAGQAEKARTEVLEIAKKLS